MATAGPAARPSTSTVFVSASAAVPGTHNDFAIGRNAAGKDVVWRYNGSSWKTVKFALPSGDYVTGVAATSSAHAWLVGQAESGSNVNTLLEAWNGSSFKVQTAGVVKDAGFQGVTASSSGAWAWGSKGTSDGDVTLLEHWNGHAWAKASTAGIPAGIDISTMATSGSSAWILGARESSGSEYVLLHWTGSSWKTTSYPGSGNAYLILNSLAAGSSSNAVATGYVSSGEKTKGIALHWNGSKWSSYNLPSNILGLTVGAAGGNAWVGGYRSTGTLYGVASIARWTGHSFAAVSLASTGDKFSEITTIAANSGTDAVALGARGTNGCDPTGQVFERLSGSKWSRSGSTLPQLAAKGLTPDC